jgi:hypothetical protein
MMIWIAIATLQVVGRQTKAKMSMLHVGKSSAPTIHAARLGEIGPPKSLTTNWVD